MEQGQPRDRQQVSRTGLLASFLMMAGSGYFELFTGLFRSVVVMRYLGPTGNGLVSIVRLLQQYLSNSHLGVLHGLTKHLPRALGAGDEERVAKIEDVGATWVLATSTLCAAGIAAIAIASSNLGLPTRYVLLIGAPVFLCGQMYDLYRAIGRAWQVYQPMVLASVVFSLALTALMIVGAWLGWASGAMLGWLAASVASLMALQATMRLRVCLRIDWSIVWRLVTSGIPLAAMAFADMLLVALDGTLLLRRGATTFGLYAGIAMQIRRYLFNLARSLTFVLMPHFLEQFARHGSHEKLRSTVMQAAAAASCAVPVLSLVSAVFLPAVVQTFVPRFYAAVPAGQVTAFATGLMILPLSFSTALVTLDAEWHSVAAQLAGAAVLAVLAWEPAGKGDMVGVALASAAGSWFVAMTVGALALSRLGMGATRLTGTLLSLQVPIGLSVAMFWLANCLAETLTGLPHRTWAGCGVRLMICVVLAGPGLAWAERRHLVLRRSLWTLAAMCTRSQRHRS